jgi:predicted alpha/beta superfamily hydrolase
MVLRKDITIPALTGELTRKAYVYLPTGYDVEVDRRYPVLYMFDGHNLFCDEEATFGKSWGLSDYLDSTNTQIIVAAVQCNTQGNGRLSEYSPVDFTMTRSGEYIKGRGKLTMDWLSTTFKEEIDGTFRTLKDRANTAIAGSSMGGLMTLYALAKYNKTYSKGAALSPSLWVGGEEVPAFMQNAHFLKDTVLYMDYGSKEFKNHSNQKSLFGKTGELLIEKKVLLTQRIVPDGVHSESSWQKQIPIFMQVLGFLPET